MGVSQFSYQLTLNMIRFIELGVRSPWGIAVFVVVLLVMISYQSSVHSQWFGPLWRRLEEQQFCAFIRMMSGGSPRWLASRNNFFKVLVEDFTQRLSIPKAFIEQMPEGLSGTVVLHGPSGNCWLVRLSKTSKGTYLAGGWEVFVKDHSLTEGEFLQFECVSSMHFNVKIFGRNGCEREDAFTVQASLKSPRADVKERKKCQSPQRDAGRIASTSKPKALGETVNEAARHFTSQHPYFLIEIKSYSVHTHRYLAVPSAFVKKLLPETRMMVLRNANGEKWKVKYRHSIGFPCRLSAGWKKFASANHIKVGDICIFELVRVNELQVHIFRC